MKLAPIPISPPKMSRSCFSILAIVYEEVDPRPSTLGRRRMGGYDRFDASIFINKRTIVLVSR